MGGSWLNNITSLVGVWADGLLGLGLLGCIARCISLPTLASCHWERWVHGRHLEDCGLARSASSGNHVKIAIGLAGPKTDLLDSGSLDTRPLTVEGYPLE